MGIEDREAYLLRILGHRRYLRTEHLLDLFYFDRTARTGRVYLSDLEALGYVGRASHIPLKGRVRGNRPYVYWITGKGASYVLERFEEEVRVPRGRTLGEAFDFGVEHRLVTNALWVDLVKAWRNGENIVNLEWRDEWRGAALQIGLDKGYLRLQPDAYVSMLYVIEGEVPVLEPEYVQSTSAPRWEEVSSWDSVFPEFDSQQTDGVERTTRVRAFVETDMGGESEAQLYKKLERYRQVRARPHKWREHYTTQQVKPGKHPPWPGMLVVAPTERRMRTLGRVFTDEKAGYQGWVLLGCSEWDEIDPETVGEEGKERTLGLVRGQCWWDIKGGRERLPFAEALQGLLSRRGVETAR